MKATTKGSREPARWVAIALIIALAASALALAQTGVRLTVQGKTVSNDIRLINGKAYVPLADMARAMNGTIVKDGAAYAIQLGGSSESGGAPVGGANEVKGTKGALGQMVFTGKWRFEAISVSHAASYESQYLPAHQSFSPNGSDELVVIQCRLKNAQTSAQKAMLSSIHPHNIALTDDQGQSYAPLAFDKHSAVNDEGPNMLPGSQTEFAVIFSVPKGIKLKDLVFSLQVAYDDYPNGGTDVRISLGQSS